MTGRMVAWRCAPSHERKPLVTLRMMTLGSQGTFANAVGGRHIGALEASEVPCPPAQSLFAQLLVRLGGHGQGEEGSSALRRWAAMNQFAIMFGGRLTASVN